VPEPVLRAQSALAPLKKGLMSALQSALAEGPEAAIAACRVEAPRIAAEASAGGVRVGRTSHRLRNPLNAPEDWMRPLLRAYQDGSTEPWLSAALPDGALGYVEPVRIQPLCLTCHGEALEAPLASRIAELYPDDRATGFADGELRGLFWAVVPEGG
jgi:hypothetical protein